MKNEPLLSVKKKLDSVEKKFDNTTFALEMLQELKAQSKRKDLIIIILIGVIATMIIGFFIYESQFETITEAEETTQTIEDIDNATDATITQTIN